MRTTSTRAIQFSLVLGILAFAANYGVPDAASQDAGWVTLFDGKSLDGWDQVGESNWRVEDGAIVADKMAGKEAGYLVSKNSYKNFVVRVGILAERRCQQRHLFPLPRSEENHRPDLLRSQHLRPAS